MLKRRIMESHHRAAKEAFHEFGRDELSVGRVERTDVGFFEDLEDRESTRNGEEKLWQILALTQNAWKNSERDGGRCNFGHSSTINNGMEGQMQW